MTEIALGYTRLSQQGKSIPEQQAMIREYCDRHGFELDAIYNDGQLSSGYTAEREEYQQLLDRLEDGDADHVVVRKLARLSRDRKHRMKLLLELDEADVDVHAVNRGERNPIDLDEPWALTREAGQADADDVEKRWEAEMGKEEAEKRQSEGLPMGRAPIGLEYGPDGTRLVPGEQYEAALEVLELLDDGRSYRAIANEVDAMSKDQVATIRERRDEYERAAREA